MFGSIGRSHNGCMDVKDTNTVFIDGVPKHFGRDAQALMSLVKTMYAHRDNQVTLFCPDCPEGRGRPVWLRYDRQTACWVEMIR